MTYDGVLHSADEISFTEFSIKIKKRQDFKKFWTYNKCTLYNYEMYLKITDINKDKAQVILFKRLFLT